MCCSTASVPAFSHPVEGGGVKLVEMLYNTNIVAIVGIQDRAIFTPRRLTLWDTNASCSRLEIAFSSPIAFVKMNKLSYPRGSYL